ncbi:MAG: hypothetical protein Q7S40_01690 [Opitutaceae bacterium]|nr:hypothetical protein [Opitutaceae bacterium]
MMKLAVFILSYGAPTALALLLFDIADSGFALRSFGLLITGLMLSLMASTGFHFFDIGPSHLKKKTSELAVCGTLAGVLFIGLSLFTLWIGGLRVGFYSTIVFSIVLPPAALIIPIRSSSPGE